MHYRNLCSEFGTWQYRNLWLKLKEAFKNKLTRPKTFKKRVMCYSVQLFITFSHRLGYFVAILYSFSL